MNIFALDADPIAAAQAQAMPEQYKGPDGVALEAWEASVAKDQRRAVQLLLRDYRELKSKLVALLAAELP